MQSKDANGIANIEDPDQTALGVVLSRSALLAQTYMFQTYENHSKTTLESILTLLNVDGINLAVGLVTSKYLDTVLCNK